MAKKEKEEKGFDSLEDEMEVLADARTKAISKLGKKDRAERDDLNIEFEVNVQELKKKWSKKKSDDAEKAAIDDEKKRIAAEKKADKEAKDKQK